MTSAVYKRFFELYLGLPEFRAIFDRNPREALAAYGLADQVRPEEFDFLRAIGDGIRQYDLHDLPKRFPAEFHELANQSSAGAPDDGEFTRRCDPGCGGDAAFQAWRLRRIRANRAVLHNRRIEQTHNIAFAFELSDGCSGACPFCCFDAPVLRSFFHHTPDNTRFWRELLERLTRRFGAVTGAAALYWATDPFDNPDFELFQEDFVEIIGFPPPFTTRFPLRAPERTVALLEKIRRERVGSARFSIVTDREAELFFRTFSPEQALLCQLVLNNPGSLNKYSITGRARRQYRSGDSKYQPGTTSACLSGFLINPIRRTIRLIAPEPPSELCPFGFREYAQGNFADLEELECWLDRTAAAFFTGPPAEPRLAAGWSCVFRDGQAHFQSARLTRSFAVTAEERSRLEGLLRAEKRPGILPDDLTAGGSVIRLLWEQGMLLEPEPQEAQE